MILSALIEAWPSETGIYIQQLPGLYASGPDEVAALDVLPDAVERHLSWLATHGAMDLPDEPLDIEIVERLAATDGRTGPLFAADRTVIDVAQRDRALTIAALGRRDLIDLYRSVSTMRRTTIPASGEWTIADHLHHVAERDLSCIAAFAAEPTPRLPEDPVHALQVSGTYVAQALQNMPETMLAAVVERDGELWTIAKTIRRMTAHIRDHEQWVRQIARS
jgi:hypothetical protein